MRGTAHKSKGKNHQLLSILDLFYGNFFAKKNVEFVSANIILNRKCIGRKAHFRTKSIVSEVIGLLALDFGH